MMTMMFHFRGNHGTVSAGRRQYIQEAIFPGVLYPFLLLSHLRWLEGLAVSVSW